MDTAKKQLTQRLGYRFSNTSLLELGLSHRSVGSDNNERLEFLGDALLNYIIAEALYHQFPKAKEGELSRMRSQLVKGATLADIAREFAIGDCLNLGAGELKSGGHRRESILADTVEALIAAIYLDGGMDICKERVRDWYSTRLAQISLKNNQKDAKTRLQEYLQSKRAPLPVYEIIDITGEAHDQTFKVSCSVTLLADADGSIEGMGSSRREAEQKAAQQALVRLQVEQP